MLIVRTWNTTKARTEYTDKCWSRRPVCYRYKTWDHAPFSDPNNAFEVHRCTDCRVHYNATRTFRAPPGGSGHLKTTKYTIRRKLCESCEATGKGERKETKKVASKEWDKQNLNARREYKRAWSRKKREENESLGNQVSGQDGSSQACLFFDVTRLKNSDWQNIQAWALAAAEQERKEYLEREAKVKTRGQDHLKKRQVAKETGRQVLPKRNAEVAKVLGRNGTGVALKLSTSMTSAQQNGKVKNQTPGRATATNSPISPAQKPVSQSKTPVISFAKPKATANKVADSKQNGASQNKIAMSATFSKSAITRGN